MSNAAFDQLIREVVIDIKNIEEYEKPPDPTTLPTAAEELQNFYKNFYSILYVKYLAIYKKAEEACDLTTQAQKLERIKFIFEALVRRILEVKSILRKLSGEYIHLDTVLVDLKVTPSVLDISVPRYFADDIDTFAKKRESLINFFQERHQIEDQSKIDSDAVEEVKIPLSIEQAILILQTNERARQGRQNAKAKRFVKEKEKRFVDVSLSERDAIVHSVILIQKIWRGYSTRKAVARRKLEEYKFLGAVAKDPLPAENDPLAIINQTKEKRRVIQKQNMLELEERRKDLRAKILSEQGDRLRREMHDATMERVVLFKQLSVDGKVKFPTEEEGGSKKFMVEEPYDPNAVVEKPPEEDGKGKKDKKGAKKDDKKKDDKKKGKKGKKEKAKKDDATIDDDPKTKVLMFESAEKYVLEWAGRENPLDFAQNLDLELLRDDIMKGDTGVEEEIRKEVDNTIRGELENEKLQEELEEGGKKAKKGKKKGKKGKKGKKDKDAGDAEPPKSLEPFLEELVSIEVIKKFPKVHLKDYLGQHRLLGSILQDWVQPSMGQVRQSVAEVILSKGSPNIHSVVPHIKGLLLYGPEKSGKTMLANAIATELNAMFIDLSPKNIDGKYEGTKETATLVRMAFAVAKEFQPAVIYIDDIETVFKSGKKKGSGARLKKELAAQVDSLEKSDRVLVVCTSKAPWDIDMKSLKDICQRMIYTVVPDYSSMQEIWRATLENRLGTALPVSFNLSVLAYICYNYGYAAGSIVRVIKRVLTEKRLKKLELRELSMEEFVGPLAKENPMYKNIGVQFDEFVKATSAPKGGKKGEKKGGKKKKKK